MCGIAGCLDVSHDLRGHGIADIASAMGATLAHRGPDDRGTWVDETSGIALAHTRLSVLDVSACGHQPMISPDGRYVLVFNGEIYNFRQIRSRLLTVGHSFRSESDTEVLIHALAEWGVTGALRQAVGMYAFAVWDRDEQVLTLARDRVGEKPLYFGWLGSTFVFASELKALRVHPAWRGTIDREALTLYLRNSYVPGPYTIFQDIRKLPPGSTLRVSRASGPSVTAERYWTPGDALTQDRPSTPQSDDQVVTSLESILRDAVRQQMVSDVPLGAFLSGGVDSATIVALMQGESERPVRTFTIGLDDPGRDEALAARAIAEHLGTAHTELYVSGEDALEIVPQLNTIYDEPFGDSSQIPTLLVSRLARQYVTVSLSGDGGDELFGGYDAYLRGPTLDRRIQRIPKSLQRPVAKFLLHRSVLTALTTLGHTNGRPLADRAARLGEIFESQGPLAVHRALRSYWVQPQSIVVAGAEPSPECAFRAPPSLGRSVAERMVLGDAMTYLPDDLLVKVDRAAMSASLETRVPMLDHRVVEFAMRLPWDTKVRNGVRKWALRQVLHRYLPPRLVDQRKRGFSVPVDEWLRGPLHSWAARLLNADRLADEGFFRPGPITARWNAHSRGRFDWSASLWAVLMFQAWYETQAR